IGEAFGIGFVIGPGIGGLLAHLGDRAPFVAAAIFALVNALVMLVAMPETLSPENRRPFHLRDAHFIGAFRPLFKAGDAVPLLIAWFVWQLAHMVYPATWSFWAAIRFHWDPTAIGLSLAFVGLVMAAVQGGLTGKIIARIGERRALVLGLTSASVSFLAFAFITRSWQAYALFLISAISGTIFPAMQGLMSRMVDATRQGALQGGIGSMSSVASIIGPLMLTQALATGVDHGFPGAAFLLAAGLAAISLVIIVTRVLGRVAPREDTPAEAL
ncbi:MAG: Tetracycline efflux protein TetA, partial [Sphingomonas bacterium]|uniref:MFS transporter n=1 Tax=Sphingomonas bacterium TaxID=1895847 RepID=UPI00262D2507